MVTHGLKRNCKIVHTAVSVEEWHSWWCERVYSGFTTSSFDYTLHTAINHVIAASGIQSLTRSVIGTSRKTPHSQYCSHVSAECSQCAMHNGDYKSETAVLCVTIGAVSVDPAGVLI